MQDLVDHRALGQVGPLERRADGHAAELDGRRRRERAGELADRRALGADDEHGAVLRVVLLLVGHASNLRPRRPAPGHGAIPLPPERAFRPERRAYDRPVADPHAAAPPHAPDPAEPVALAVLRDLAAAADDAIIVTDAADRVLVWNGAAERLYGIDAGDALGRPIVELTEATIVGDVDVPTWLAREIAVATGAWRGRVIERPTIGRLAGREVVVEAALSRLADDAGTVAGVLNVKRDITASYRLERELATLGSLATATGTARSRAEIAQAAVDVLCSASGAEFGVILRFADDRTTIDAAHGLEPEMDDRIAVLARRRRPIFKLIEQRGKVVVGPIEALPVSPEGRAWLAATGVAALAVVGIHRAEHLVGAMLMGWLDGDHPRPSAATLLQASEHVGRALENADLVEEITRRAEAEQALVRRLAVLDELSRLGASVASADELADRSAHLVGRALGASGTGYGLFAADGSGYDTSTTVGVRQPIAEWLASAVPAERRAIKAWRAGGGSILERFEPEVVTTRRWPSPGPPASPPTRPCQFAPTASSSAASSRTSTPFRTSWS